MASSDLIYCVCNYFRRQSGRRKRTRKKELSTFNTPNIFHFLQRQHSFQPRQHTYQPLPRLRRPLAPSSGEGDGPPLGREVHCHSAGDNKHDEIVPLHATTRALATDCGMFCRNLAEERLPIISESEEAAEDQDLLTEPPKIARAPACAGMYIALATNTSTMGATLGGKTNAFPVAEGKTCVCVSPSDGPGTPKGTSCARLGGRH